MFDKQSSSKNHETNSVLHSKINDSRCLSKNHTASIARSALARAVTEINTVNKIRRREIGKLSCLVEELQYLQPVSIIEISDALGQSLNTTRSQLKKLQKLDLVVKTSFEHHSLYCLNGHFNLFITEVFKFLEYSR